MRIFHSSSPEEAAAPSHVQLGYPTELARNRGFAAILGMALAITPAALYGGGQLSMVVGLLVVGVLDGCVAASLAELASRFPTSSGVYYWSYRLLLPNDKPTGASSSSAAAAPLSYIAGWFWLIGNWTIALSVNFDFASLVAATVDRIAAVWNLLTIVVVLVVVAATARSGRHTAATALGHYDPSFSGWGPGFAFFIGLLPPAYTFCAIGMVTSMAEECEDPETQVPRAMTLCMPLGGVAALVFVLPLCFTLPPQADLLAAPYGQALPYILARVVGGGGGAGAVAVMALVFGVALFCSVSITTTASRCTWAFARDAGIPGSRLWARTAAGQPLPALALVTVVQMLLGLINLGSTSAFTAFVSVGVIGLAVGYLVPIVISLATRRREVATARWRLSPAIGIAVNIVAVLWIVFELVLFSMPQALPVTPASMNYASVVFVGFSVISAGWYCVAGRRKFKGPPEETRIN
ncbi:Amino acid/polyamine transporter I [Akanthomyces lecanii RCEF 1005]|uniref:Amino acid/polyamine transporter I n=1 Tax=Akanthomyces lecanii RCEF 1005 TaxID=1081108 RepID=A0A168FIC9_CORDF|nr:Amino acid/polyamine transporter I [Akanthomyces lecanii RCEF 1005]